MPELSRRSVSRTSRTNSGRSIRTTATGCGSFQPALRSRGGRDATPWCSAVVMEILRPAGGATLVHACRDRNKVERPRVLIVNVAVLDGTANVRRKDRAQDALGPLPLGAMCAEVSMPYTDSCCASGGANRS